MKKILISSLFVSILVADSFTIMPYSSFLDYGSNSAKKEGVALGIYGSYYNIRGHKLEIGYEKLDVSYYQTQRETLKQYDATLIYSNYIGYNYILKTGIHHIKSTLDGIDNTLTYILGIKRYNGLIDDYGVDIFYSDYKSQEPKIKVYQATPYYGFAFGNHTSAIGSFYLKTKYNYVKIDSLNSNLEDKSSFAFTLNNYNGKFTTTIEAIIGEQMYAVHNGGFTVYDNENIYKNSWSVALQYAINKNEYIKAKIGATKFEDEETKRTSTLTTGGLFYGASF